MKQRKGQSIIHSLNQIDPSRRRSRGLKDPVVLTLLLLVSLAFNLIHLLPTLLLVDQDDAGQGVPTVQQEYQFSARSQFPEQHGNGYEIWYPSRRRQPKRTTKMTTTTIPQPILTSPEVIVTALEQRYQWLDTITTGNADRSPRKRAAQAYAELLKYHVSGLVFGNEERKGQMWKTNRADVPVDVEIRKEGKDWAYLGSTMTGWRRLDNVRELLEYITDQRIPGDYIETGVWRGGSSIFARGVMRSLNQGHRLSFVCDSFQGLPPGDRNLDYADKGWDRFTYLQISADHVETNFAEASLLDDGVVFVKGYFNETMPQLRKGLDAISIMRLDGDMYESTVDVMYNLYDKLSIGGFLVMDDWDGYPSKTACEDFFRVHGIHPEVKAIDTMSAYWKKTEQVEIQYWRYIESNFK